MTRKTECLSTKMSFINRGVVMDIKQLIAEVEHFPEIWNPKHRLYHHRPRLAEIWQEIAIKTGLSKAVCKSKWKSLRDNYRREYKKTLRHRLINNAATSGWVHFYQLKFLEQVLDRKEINMQVMQDHSSEKVFELDPSDIECVEDDIETVMESDGQEPLISMSDENYDYVRQQQEQQQLRFLNQQQRTSKRCCRHAPGDEIMHFFRSITPYLQMMDATKKLRVRIEIQEIILNELSRRHEKPVEVKTPKATSIKKTETKSFVPTRVSKRIVKKNRKYFRK